MGYAEKAPEAKQDPGKVFRAGLLLLREENIKDALVAFEHAHGLDPDEPGRRFHAILVDIDHSPRSVLHPTNSAFYEKDGLIGSPEELEGRDSYL